jgi:hypothetical protein
MKRFITLLAVIGMFGFQGCEGPEGPPGQDGLIAEVFQVKNVSFTFENDYNPVIPLSPAILPSEMVLLYRQDGIDNGAPVWKLTPELYYLQDGTFDFGYNYNFTVNDVSVYMDGFDLGNVSTALRLNQTFRIVIIPGYITTGKSINKPDYSDYKAVIAKYGIDDSKVKELILK